MTETGDTGTETIYKYKTTVLLYTFACFFEIYYFKYKSCL